MRLTDRCKQIMKLLEAARWLSTRQLHRRFFGRATVDVTRDRLHKLVEGGYLLRVQPNRMQEALFTLGRAGKRLLEREGAGNITLERQLPKQLEHLLGVNDIRIAAELSMPLSYLFAYWELPGLQWNHPILPDAVFGVGRQTFAIEFDRGTENIRFFCKTKLSIYRRGLEGFPLSRVVVVTDRRQRMESLAKAVVDDHSGRIVFTTLDRVRQDGLTAPIFFETVDGEGVKLL